MFTGSRNSSSTTTISSSTRSPLPAIHVSHLLPIHVPLVQVSGTSDNGSNFSNSPTTSGDPAKDNTSAITNAAYWFAFCAALNSCNLGYDIGVSTNAGPKIQSYFALDDGRLELFLGSINFWSILGALLSPYVTDRWGRRATFRAAAVAFIVGCGTMATAVSFSVLMVGRCVVGIGVGVGEAIDPMYIAEIAPSQIRGELVSWAEAGVAVGVVLGFSSSLLLYAIDHWIVAIPEHYQWRIMLALGGILPLVMLVLVAKVMPESPRWLLAKQQPLAAKQVLQRIYDTDHVNVDAIVHDIQASLVLEQEAARAVGWKAVLCRPSPAIRRMLLVGVGVAIIQQLVGIDSVMFYLLYVIQGSGIESDMGQILALIVLGTVKLIFVFVGAKLFDRAGRRPLLFISLVGCGLSLVFVSIMFEEDEEEEREEGDNPKNVHHASRVFTVVGLAFYLAFFSTGLGPGNWVVVSEVFATSIRAKAMSLAVLPNRITATVMASTFLSIADWMSWSYFFLALAGVCFVSALFLFVYLPETKGRSLEDMAVYFAEITGDRAILDVEERLMMEQQQKGNNHTSHNDDMHRTGSTFCDDYYDNGDAEEDQPQVEMILI